MKDSLVSICCLTYNHIGTIEKAIHSFLMQKTDFPVEIFIHDDASSDGTSLIIQKFQKENPELIRLLIQQENQYSKGKSLFEIYSQIVFPQLSGKYIAICEGDDYWTDPLKLQKQVDFLDENPEYSICFHKTGFTGDTETDFHEHEKYYKDVLNDRTTFELSDLIRNNFIPNCSVVYRNCVQAFPDYFSNTIFPDWPLHIIFAQQGKIGYINQIMAVHHKRRDGIWEGLSPDAQMMAMYQFYYNLLQFAGEKNHSQILDAFQNLANASIVPDLRTIFDIGFSLGAITYQLKNEGLQLEKNLIYNSYTWKTANCMRIISEKFLPKETMRRRLVVGIFRNSLKIAREGKHWITETFSRIKEQKQKPETVQVTNKAWSADKPLVSVIIFSFNGGKSIGQTIQSVLDQTWQNLEMIVVDDGSNDGETIEVIKKISHPKIRIFLCEGRRLAGSNQNFGIEEAIGKYVCCLDSDSLIEPTFIEKALFYLEVFNNDVVCSWVETFGAKSELWKTSPADFVSLTKVDNAVVTNALFRKVAWQQVSGFGDYTPGENQFAEDWEFWTRLAGQGYRFAVIPEPLYKYRVGDDCLSTLASKNHPNQVQEIRNADNGWQTPHYTKSRRKNSQKIYQVKNPFVNLQVPKTKKRILVALPFMVVGGLDNLLISVFGELANKYEIIFLTTLQFDERNGDSTKFYQKISQRIYHLPRFLSNEIEMRAFLLFLVQAYRIDLMYIAGSEFCYHCLPEIKKGNPDIKVMDFLFKGSVHIENSMRYSKYIERNIVENEISQNHLIQVYNVNPKKTALIHTGINTGNFSLKADAQLLKKQFGVPDEKFIVAFVARFSPEKQPASFVGIARKIADPEMLFFMAGKGPIYEEILQQIQYSNLQNKILTPGFVDSHDVLSVADVLVLPSTIEGRPLIVLEAMTMGVPVIASNIGGLPTMITNGENGFLLEPDDLDGFARKIMLLKENKDIYQKIKTASQCYAMVEFDEQVMHKKYQMIISTLIEDEK